MSGEQLDAPNKEALGLAPPWVEGTGGTGGPAADPAAAGETLLDLDGMTKDELLDHARSLGVSPANAAMSKDELRAGIEEHG